MMTSEELLKRIQLGEDSFLELKQVDFSGDKIIAPHKNSIADELAAFANSKSGTIIFGVTDTKVVQGIPLEMLDTLETWIRTIVNDTVDPPLNCIIQKMYLPNANGEEVPIIAVDIPNSLFVHQSPGGYFIRIGSSKRKMKPDMLARLFQQRSQSRIIRFDEQEVHDALVSDLNTMLWQRFRTPISPRDDFEFLSKLKLITKGEGGEYHPTIAGVLIATDHPEKFLPNAFIQAVVYKSNERNASKQLDSKDITGPIDSQIRDACLFVERNTRVYATKNPNRIETPQFSPNAIFEAIVNAVAHRDYSVYGSKIRLHIFEDRVELFSPGSLPNTMTVDSLSERQSSRNELLGTLLARCPMNYNALGSTRNYLMDKRGEGVPIIIQESEKLSGKKPEYKLLDDAELMLTIFAAPEPE